MRSIIALSAILAFAAASPVPPPPDDVVPTNMNKLAPALAMEGENCGITRGMTDKIECAEGLICLSSKAADALGTCVKDKENKKELAKEGEKCGITMTIREEIKCEEGLECEPAPMTDVLGTCKKAKDGKEDEGKEGDRCGITWGMSREAKCGKGLRCEGATGADVLGTCAKDDTDKPELAKEGDSCGLSRGMKEEIKCEPGLKCEGSTKADKLGKCVIANPLIPHQPGNDTNNGPKPGEKGAKCGWDEKAGRHESCYKGLRCRKDSIPTVDGMGTCQPFFMPMRPIPMHDPADIGPVDPKDNDDEPKVGAEGDKCDIIIGNRGVKRTCGEGLTCMPDPMFVCAGLNCPPSTNSCRKSLREPLEPTKTGEPKTTEPEPRKTGEPVPTDTEGNDPGAKREAKEGEACTYGGGVKGDICGKGLICDKPLVGGAECINPDAPCPGVCQPEMRIMPVGDKMPTA